jgi:hypothetical protein
MKWTPLLVAVLGWDALATLRLVGIWKVQKEDSRDDRRCDSQREELPSRRDRSPPWSVVAGGIGDGEKEIASVDEVLTMREKPSLQM